MQTKTDETVASDIRSNGEYRIEAVRVKDHALIRDTVTVNTAGKKLYAALTGDQVALTDIRIR